MHVQELICFGAHPGAGNPALVIEDDRLDLDARQRFASARNTTCVFLDPGADGMQVDYFYPHMRSPLCLHATLAVARVLFARAGAGGATGGTIPVRTAMQGQRLDLSREGADYFVRLAPQAAPAVEVSDEELARLLGAPGLALISRPRVASVGSPKLLVEVPALDTLHALRPDLEAIAAWGRVNAINGLYVYCRLDEHVYEGRNFNHLEPRLEDAATGVAAGALTVALGRGIALRQGRAVGRDCLIRTRIEDGAIFVGGAAEALTP